MTDPPYPRRTRTFIFPTFALVLLAGHTVGPVWFERRPDRAFRNALDASMDGPVEGALGGALFQYFRITVDYPGARAHFHRPE